MMGYSHSISAAAGWLALNELHLVHVNSTEQLIVTTLACAGAGMLPDIDHKNGTIAHSMSPLSSWVTALVAKIFGGHRKGTHSLVGLLIFWGMAISAEQLTYRSVPWASLLITAFMGGLALRVFGAPGGWIGAIVLGWFAWSADALAFTPLAIATGATIHILGDFLTTRGVNLVWPFALTPPVATKFWRKSGYMALPLLGDAGSAREHIFTSVLTCYLAWYSLALIGVITSFPLEFLTKV